MSHGYRALAAAVITRAIKDAHGHAGGPGVAKATRQSRYRSAKAFLDPENEQFRLYCDMLDLEPEALYDAIRRNGRSFVSLAREPREAS